MTEIESVTCLEDGRVSITLSNGNNLILKAGQTLRITSVDGTHQKLEVVDDNFYLAKIKAVPPLE